MNGLMVSIVGKDYGHDLSEEDVDPVVIEEGEIGDGTLIPWLNLSMDGDVTVDVKCRIANASRVFGCLRRVFNNLFCHESCVQGRFQGLCVQCAICGYKTWKH